MASAALRFLAVAGVTLLVNGCAWAVGSPSREESPRRAAKNSVGTTPPERPAKPAPAPARPAVAVPVYVNAVDAATRLGMKAAWGEPGKELTLSGAGERARLTAGSREVLANGLRVFLGNPVITRNGQLQVSKTDFERVLTPLLKPSAAGVFPPLPKVIAIDPGHGGIDNGMENQPLRLKEKELALDVALRLKKLLEARGFEVVLTRKDDRTFSSEKKIDLPMRARAANRAGADLFVSIHFNSLFPNVKIGGTEVYVYTRAGQRSDQSLGVGQEDDTIVEPMAVNRFDAWSLRLAHELHREVIGELKTLDRGLKTKHLLVLQDLDCPAVLVESVFLSHESEAKLAATTDYRQRIAVGLAEGIKAYAETLAAVRPKPKPETKSSSGASKPRAPPPLIMKHLPSLRLAAALALGLAALGSPLRAWDYEGHRTVNQLALASLPKEFPAFVRAPAAAERVAFLGGEPDRWRNVPDLPLKQSGGSWTDHFCDLEQIPLAGLDVATLPSFRYDFIAKFAAGRAANAAKFPVIDPAKNLDHSREWPGFVPWAITEYFGRLRSAFSYLKTFEELGTPEEIANAEANALYVMGVMGHYVGDCAQPLHTTDHYNGWVGPNPHGYTTWPGFHSWIDGGFLGKAGVKYAELAPKVTVAAPISLAPREDGRDPLFVAVLDYLLAQHQFVEPLYQLEKAGKLSRDEPPSAEGRAFLSGQLLKGGQMLGAIWVTAWRSAPPDTYLRNQLIKRQVASATAAPAAKPAP